MAAVISEPQNRMIHHTAGGRHRFTIWQAAFEVDEKYIPIKPIGKGAYGVVCSSYNTETNEKVAIKKIHKVFDNKIDALRTLRELQLLRHVRHENVIALKDVMLPTSNTTSTTSNTTSTGGDGDESDSDDGRRRRRRRMMMGFNDVYLVYELMDSDLHRIIKSDQPLSDDHAKYFLFQLLQGLKYLHSANILHRDLKPGNLLVNANCELKICDFGLARTGKCQGQGQFMTEYVVTRWYRAPELLLCCDYYGTSIDIWSVGCIFAEILGRKPIFPGTDCLNQLRLILALLGSPQHDDDFIDNLKARKYVRSLPSSGGIHLSRLYPQADPLAIDLLMRMLVFDPRKRVSADEALRHPYLAGLYDPGLSPTARFPIHLDVDENSGDSMVRELMWREMLYYHPEAGLR